MSSYLKTAAADPWVQLSFLLGLVSGGLALGDGWRPGLPLPQAAKPQPVTVQVAPSVTVLPTVTVNAQTAPSPGPAIPPSAHKDGQWIVDKSLGAGADAASLESILSKVQDGDVVYLRPGVYAESVVVAKSISIVGTGARRDDVRLASDGPVTLAIVSGKVLLKNLTIANGGSETSSAVSTGRDAQLETQGVSIWAAGEGLRVSGGKLSVSGTEVSARIALLVEGAGAAAMDGGSLSGLNVGVLMKGDAMDAQFKGVKFSKCERAIDVEGKSAVTVSGSEFSLKSQGGAIFAFAGAMVTVSSSTFELNHLSQVGLFAQEASATLSDSKIRGSKGGGVVARRGATINLDRVELSDNEWAGLVASDAARVRATDSQLTGNLDCGIDIDGAKVELERATVRGNRCGVAFHGAGNLSARGSVFEKNTLGSAVVKPGLEGQVSVTGTNNKGLVTGDELRAAAAAPAPETRKYFSTSHLGPNPFAHDPQGWRDRLSQNQR